MARFGKRRPFTSTLRILQRLGWCWLVSYNMRFSSSALRSPNPPLSMIGGDSSSSPSSSMDNNLIYTAEVVGAKGRIGTFWLDRHFSSATNEQTAAAVACPRGTAPGSQTRKGAPIYVATSSDAYLQIYENTLPSRRSDLVFVGNAGLLVNDRFRDCTILVPHFSVLYKNQLKDDKDDDQSLFSNNTGSDSARYKETTRIQVNTDPLLSPPTYIFGKHATTAQNVLEANGIQTCLVDSFREIQAYSGRKLLWASCLWLLCHDPENQERFASLPLTVGQVHEWKQSEVDRLADELLSSLRELLSLPPANNKNRCEKAPKQSETRILREILDPTMVREYLRAYSTSISNAFPSGDLAKQEYHDRNEVWLLSNGEISKKKQEDQPFHVELLKRQGIDATGLK